VVAALQLAKRAGYKDVISFDMGGTTAKASLIEDGKFALTSEAEIGSGITLSSRLTKGGGYALKLPMIDLSEVGAGGGSIARLDRGSLKVGPQSSGARPGPVCYDQGGEEITITDANVLLGYINPESIAGGAVPLNRERTARIFEQKIARPMGKDISLAAYGIHTVANAAMIRAVKAVSTYRGRDPRDFVLFAFGGSGPVHAAHMARELGMRRVVVPPAPGLFSCLGMLLADVEHHLVHTFLGRTTNVSVSEMNALFSEMEKEGFAQLVEGGYPHHQVMVQRFADLRYEGQAFELSVPVPNDLLEKKDFAALDEAFGREHEKEYGHRGVDEPVEMVNLRVTLRVVEDKIDTFRPLADVAGARSQGRQASLQRQAYFGPLYGMQRAPVISRHDLERIPRSGPLIIDEYDSTAVIPPKCKASLDDLGNIVIDIA
jgi:N-methylhydantoinase A